MNDQSWNERYCNNKCDLSTCRKDVNLATRLDFRGCKLHEIDGMERVKDIKKVVVDGGNGEWKDSNGQPYLHLNADDHYWLGLLEGLFLREQTEVLDRLLKIGFLKHNGNDYSHLVDQYKKIPKDYRDELKGFADGLNKVSDQIWTEDDLLLQNTFFDIYYGQLGVDAYMGCTAFGIHGKNGEKIIGQNFDLDPVSKDGLSFVHHKVNDQSSVFSLRLGSVLSFPVGKNEHGIVSTTNVIRSNRKGKFTTPLGIRSRKAFEESETAEEFIDIMTEDDPTASYNVMVTDGDEMLSIQVNPEDIRERKIRKDDFLVHSNRYLDPEWNKKYFARGNYSRNRQERSEREVEKRMVDATEEKLIEILKLKDSLPNLKDSEICRTEGDSQTLAFITDRHFGLGTVYDGLGKIPI